MVIMNIIQNCEVQARTVAGFLIAERFATSVHIDTNRLVDSSGELNTVRVYFITKSLLYDLIESEINERFPHLDAVIYATPVTHINKDQAQHIKSTIRAA